MNTPAEITQLAINTGQRKIHLMKNSKKRLIVASILAGAFISLGGILSVIGGQGLTALSAGNPAIPKLVAGALFPVGLILVVILGAELFTGNNSLLIPAYMQRRYGIAEIGLNWTIVYFGNLIGALLFTYFLVFQCGLVDSDPYRDGVLEIAVRKTSMTWFTVFLKGIGANWCVCLGIWLAISSKTFVGKVLGCWIPVMTFVALGFEHCIANMFYLPLALMAGSDITIGECVVRNLIPATLGNILGGALFVGMVHSWLHPHQKKVSDSN